MRPASSAGATGRHGNGITSETFQFQVQSAPPEGQEAAQQPAPHEESKIRINPAPPVDALEGMIGVPMAIEPEEAYETPQWLWLTLPPGADLNHIQLWYYKTSGQDAGWYPSGAIAGFLEPGTLELRQTAGLQYIGVQINHGGIVALRSIE